MSVIFLIKITNNGNKIYHFIYQGIYTEDFKQKLCWQKNILSDSNDIETTNFDTIYSDNSKVLMQDTAIERFDWHKKTGIKRKKSYLFHGPSGTGKTSSIIAMANYDKRHIIEASAC